MFSENLKALRKARGMTQEELAARLHVVRQTVSKWEKGLSVPDAELLIRLAEVLDTTVGQLLGAAGPDQRAAGHPQPPGTVHPPAGTGHPGRHCGGQSPARGTQLRGVSIFPGPGGDRQQYQ